MANLVPSLERINKFPKPLEPGERALMEALCTVLDDDWTICVQPCLNGLNPDIIIFSEEAGLGIFEVKDWNLNAYRPQDLGKWDVYDSGQARWLESKVTCPLAQVMHYKDSILHYELPELEAEIVLDRRVYGLLATFVYFHKHTTQEARDKTARIQAHYPYVSVFGHDGLQAQKLRGILSQRHLERGSYFAALMRRHDLHNRLRNALTYPEYGRTDVDDILFDLPKPQQDLLSNPPGRRRVIGSAGSGKSMIAARKAVNAALSGQWVLIVCYNITMVNYLSDIVRRLARHKSRDGQDAGRNIMVRHFHRMFPNEHALEDPEVKEVGIFDVVLIDEGQDFPRAWLDTLLELTRSDRTHVMLLEDDRQNIYGVEVAERRVTPGFIGRPRLLKRTFRLNAEVAATANRLIAMSGCQFESGDLEADTPRQTELLRPTWIEGRVEALLDALTNEVRRLVNGLATGALADIVILVCTVEDGWHICDRLDGLHLPYSCNFESRQEHERARELHAGPNQKMDLYKLRRGRKLAFQMQTGSIKVCTIHSFKGWELRRVLVYFNPIAEQEHQNRIALLYTAMTRAQESLMIFNAEPTLSAFGRRAAEEGLVTLRHVQAAPEASSAPGHSAVAPNCLLGYS